MTDEKPAQVPAALQHLAEIYRLLGKNEARIAGLTRHLEELLRLLGKGDEGERDLAASDRSEEPSKSDGKP